MCGKNKEEQFSFDDFDDPEDIDELFWGETEDEDFMFDNDDDYEEI